jgi:hypothetical protein
VRSGRTPWSLLGALLVACWSAAAGLQIASEPSGAASRTREARPTQPSILPSDLPRIVASETQHRKLIRGQGGKSFGKVPEAMPLPLVARPAPAPVWRGGMPRSALPPPFKPRGPPSLIV